MKYLTATILALFVSFCSAGAIAGMVNGYTKSNGTYVHSYYRSSPNYTVRDNYTYINNYNPYTGKKGTNYYRNAPSSYYYNGNTKAATVKVLQ